MHVLHVIPTLGSGGAERVLATLAAAQAAGSHRVSVVATSGGGTFAEDIGGVARLAVWHTRGAWYNLVPFARLCRLVRASRPDVVHAWAWHPNMMCALLYRVLRVPVVISHHRLQDDMGRLRAVASRVMFRNTGLRHVCVSEAVASSVADTAGVPRSASTVIYNGIDAEGLTRTAADAVPLLQDDERHGHLVLGTMARLEHRKGIRRFVEAAARVQSLTGQRVLCLVAGRPTAEIRAADLHRWAAELGVDLRHHPHVERGAFLRSLDVYVQASDTEGFPLAPLEAMACGLPVVATSVGGARELVPPPGLAPVTAAGVAEVVARLAADPVQLEEHGRLCLQRARAFSVEKMTAAYADVYHRAIRSAAS